MYNRLCKKILIPKLFIIMKRIFLTICTLFIFSFFSVHADQPFSGEMSPAAVRTVCDAVASWQIENFKKIKRNNLSWTNGALYRGMIEWANLEQSQEIFDFLMKIGKANRWAMASRVYHADDICVGQAFIEMYRKYKDPRMLQPAMERAFYVASHPSDALMSKADERGKDERWSWADALFMAAPVYAALYAITGEQIYFDYMDREFRICTDSLYDKKEHLYYRDCMRIPLREPNGSKQFWGRGNGWVFAAIPLVLENLPKDHPAREYYLTIFKEMAERVADTQDKTGTWHASLLDPVFYPDPENSVSAFFCYGLGWGIRNGYLSARKYMKVLEKGWASLVSYVDHEGKLGYVQPIGNAPRKANAASTEVYGVGGFLLAGSEVMRLCK